MALKRAIFLFSMTAHNYFMVARQMFFCLARGNLHDHFGGMQKGMGSNPANRPSSFFYATAPEYHFLHESYFPLVQRQTNQSVSLICHEQRNV